MAKQQASQNAVRHRLTAETVLELLEDPEEYKAFEQAVAADFDAESAAASTTARVTRWRSATQILWRARSPITYR